MLKLLEKLENRLSAEYEQIEVTGEKCFLLSSGTVAHLIAFMEWRAVAVEYAESIEAAQKNMFEDGDLWPIDEMTEDEIYESIIEEIRKE